uniref:Receptor kinase n=3 Tax=Oryza sativa subsp. japonica TaxID=39947 RepID=Q10BL2_ORYSJ|nr:putative receptor kinase [Oryza sativa Japonica Group]ABF99525.1 receptor-like kinase, putative [Oryza sativa Japonica Group]
MRNTERCYGGGGCMRLGRNPRTGTEWSLTSWGAPDDLMMGDCRRVMDTRRLLDNISWRSADKKYRTGQWNGMWFSGVPEMASYSSMFANQVVVKPDGDRLCLLRRRPLLLPRAD